MVERAVLEGPQTGRQLRPLSASLREAQTVRPGKKERSLEIQCFDTLRSVRYHEL